MYWIPIAWSQNGDMWLCIYPSYPLILCTVAWGRSLSQWVRGSSHYSITRQCLYQHEIVGALLNPEYSILLHCIPLTCVDIVVSVQCGKLLAVVPGKRVSSAAMVSTDSQLVEVGLRLNTEAGIFCKGLASSPVFQGHQQLVGALVCQPVDVL